MKNIVPYLLILVYCLPLAGFAQNVSVGTKAATYPLTVKDSLGSGRGFAQVSPDGQTAVGTFVANGNAYIQTHTNTDLKFATNDGSYQMIIQKSTGNVGIGSVVPTQKLEVAGNVKINGNLQVAGGSPAAGKVLTSDATGNATWVTPTSSFGNTERFQFQLRQVGGAFPLTFSTKYNLGTATAQFINSYSYFTLYISRAGLYHFSLDFDEYGYEDFTQEGSTPKLASTYMQIIGGSSLELTDRIDYKHDTRSTSYTYKANGSKTIEMYLPANSQIVFGASGNFTYSCFLYFTLTGHLISD